MRQFIRPKVLRSLYTVGCCIYLPVVLLMMAWRGFKQKEYWQRWGERLGYLPKLPGNQHIWVHAVSMGETRAAVPLIRALMERYPEHRILVTNITPTGSNLVRDTFGDAVDNAYVPYDLPGPVGRFFRRFNPRFCIILETEIWPNLIFKIAKKQIPLVLVNARLSTRSRRAYHRISGDPLMSEVLHCMQAISAQSAGDAQRLIDLGAPADRVDATGNIKFDLVIPEDLASRGQALRSQLGANRPIWVMASTHDGEEELALQVQQQLLSAFPNLLLVLVPRHPDRFSAVATQCRRMGFEPVIRSTGAYPQATDSVYLVDTMGELSLIYAAADLACLGGSFVPIGGHNLLEASALGLPTITGPHMHNFEEIADLLVGVGATHQVENADELTEVLSRLLTDENECQVMRDAALAVTAENRGALSRLLDIIQRVYPSARVTTGED